MYENTAPIQAQQAAESIALPNGDSFYFVNTITLGEALVTSAVFLLFAFLVLKWLLDKVWGRS